MLYNYITKSVFLFFLIGLNSKLNSQTYFPPKTGTQWDTISHNRLGWCQDSINSLVNFLGEKNTKSFMILKDGKIVLEHYFGNFTKDSFWYWASAGKTVTAALVGIAQHEKILNINDSTSKYLGVGWTSCTPQQEGKITVKNQLTMTTGLEENLIDADCKTPACLKYEANAGTRWYYYNAPYLLLQDVVANASGITYNQYTQTRLNTKIGANGLWINGVYYSKTRDIARFGLMILNNGIWNNDTIIKDRQYFNEMVNTSQNLNKSYGYLFWLNGKESAMLPQSSLVFNQMLFPPAPTDMFAGLGKNDQKVYVIPSQNMVVVRMGNSAGPTTFGPSGFDNQLWSRIMNLNCKTNIESIEDEGLKVYPNPITNKEISVFSKTNQEIEIINSLGQTVLKTNVTEGENIIIIDQVSTGVYILKHENGFLKMVVGE